MPAKSLFRVILNPTLKEGGMRKKLNKYLKKKFKRINRIGIGIMRDSLATVLSRDDRTKRFVGIAKRLKSELRAVGAPKAGSGLTFRFTTSNKIEMRILLTENILGTDGYWTLITAQYGRKAISSSTPIPMYFKKRVAGAKLSKMPRKRGYGYVMFRKSTGGRYKVGPVKPWFNWIEQTEALTIKEFKKEIKKIL